MYHEAESDWYSNTLDCGSLGHLRNVYSSTCSEEVRVIVAPAESSDK